MKLDILGIVTMLSGLGVVIYGAASPVFGHPWYVPYAATGGGLTLMEAGWRVLVRNITE